MDDLDYSIDNIGGIEHLDVVLKPGVNVLRGRERRGEDIGHPSDRPGARR